MSEINIEEILPYQQAERVLIASIANTIITTEYQQKITRIQLEKLAGVNNGAVRDLIQYKSTFRLSTLLKILALLGKTLGVMPLQEDKQTIDKNLSDSNRKDFLPEKLEGCDLITSIAHAIKTSRKEKKITLEKLEDISGVHKTSIKNVINNRVDPKLSTLIKILTPLGKTLGVIPLQKE